MVMDDERMIPMSKVMTLLDGIREELHIHGPIKKGEANRNEWARDPEGEYQDLVSHIERRFNEMFEDQPGAPPSPNDHEQRLGMHADTLIEHQKALASLKTRIHDLEAWRENIRIHHETISKTHDMYDNKFRELTAWVKELQSKG